MFERNRSKKVELLAKVYDHAKHCYKFGFRMLILEWSDGSTFLPVNSVLLSTENRKNRLNEAKAVDKKERSVINAVCLPWKKGHPPCCKRTRIRCDRNSNIDIFQLLFNYLEERPYNNIYQNVKQDADHMEAAMQEKELNEQYKKT